MKRFLIGLLLLGACASQRKGPPRLDEAMALKGLKLAEVEAKLGAPADAQGTRRYWFLSTESKYHPEPKARLYEFIFVNDKLNSIVEQKH